MNPKIVRDKIPEIIVSSNKTPIYEIVSTEDAIAGLEAKLSEELSEYLEDHSLEEMADLLEVIHGILELKEIPWERLEEVRLKKRQERGGFSEKILLTDILQPGQD